MTYRFLEDKRVKERGVLDCEMVRDEYRTGVLIQGLIGQLSQSSILHFLTKEKVMEGEVRLSSRRINHLLK